MQQYNQVPRNEILWRVAEASVLPLLANRAQIGAARHLLSIPAASPLLELETTAFQQLEHPNVCLQPSSHSSPFPAHFALL